MDHLATAAALRALTHALAPVREYLEDPLTQEIEINGPDDVWVERAGVQAKVPVSISATQLETAISVLARLSDKDAKAGTADGIIDARMDGFRVAAALPPTSVRGPSMCIRKHNPVHLTLNDYVQSGALSAEWAERLRAMVRSHKNLLVAGGTSSGKTTFVNALLAEIPAEERILTIEDTPELKVSAPNWVSLESNTQAGISTRDLVRLALRYRPDRVIVGEVRGGEAFDLLDAANTGHDGVIATLHASSSFDALSRFETLILRAGIDWPHRAICAQIARTIDFVIFMARRNGVRRLQEVLEVQDHDNDRYVTAMLFDAH
ncbi:MAG: pilus assembly protein CpaF [Azoarcus sp.]|nr:pilus assembly protein CpaF [Azoarcus sp.]